jgi:hypothetical protein
VGGGGGGLHWRAPDRPGVRWPRAGRLYFMATPLPPSASGVHFFTMDNQMRYAPFCDDFGPFNLGMTHHFWHIFSKVVLNLQT